MLITIFVFNMEQLLRHSNIKYVALIFISCCLFFYACKEKYLPVIKDNNPNYLVIDGFINTGSDSTIFKLSRTFKLESKAVIAPEKAAIVTVESDAGLSYTLPELPLKAGTYAVPALNLEQTKKYRLRVRTRDNKEYLSDFVESKVSPQVEVTYDFKHGDFNIYANSNDPSGKSRYYQYRYDETWEYVSKIRSLLKIENHRMVDRRFPEDNIYNCFRYFPSGRIAITSTTSLTEDRVADYPLEVIPASSDKIRVEYSMLVKQMVLTRAGFEFFETLRKNTEQVGSIFDSQPSQLYGNIRCTTNPAEFVLGFISAGTVTQKRLLVLAANLPYTLRGPAYDAGCEASIDTIRGGDLKRLLLDPVVSLYIPIMIDEKGILTASKEKLCVDCRLEGGTTVMPSYWIK